LKEFVGVRRLLVAGLVRGTIFIVEQTSITASHRDDSPGNRCKDVFEQQWNVTDLRAVRWANASIFGGQVNGHSEE
jgi:hypothetical protein